VSLLNAQLKPVDELTALLTKEGRSTLIRLFFLICADLFLINSLPYLVNGISRHRFQALFSSPPAVGVPIINVVWEIANIAVACC